MYSPNSFRFIAVLAVEHHPGEPILPIEEDKVYGYACACRDCGRSASRIDAIVGTLRYVGGEFGFTGAEVAAKSPRVLGAAHSMLLNRPPRRRAEALTPSIICWLEIACFAVPDAYDRVIAGMYAMLHGLLVVFRGQSYLTCRACGKVRGRSSFKDQNIALKRKGYGLHTTMWYPLLACLASRGSSSLSRLGNC